VAVLCDTCIAQYQEHHEPLRFVCRGYATDAARAPVAELSDVAFKHDEVRHRA